jgi:hypothetical protein
MPGVDKSIGALIRSRSADVTTLQVQELSTWAQLGDACWPGASLGFTS